MSAVVSYAKAKEGQPDEAWSKFITNPNRWRLTVDGKEFPPGTDFLFKSRFGEVKSAVVIGKDGTLTAADAFDRPVYVEIPFTQTVVWGRGDNGLIYFGMVEQERPHADEPGKHGIDGHKPVRFLHVIMGFNEKAATGKFETADQAAAREAGEEAGAGGAVIKVEVYKFGHNPSPSFTPTWGGVVGVQVDLAKLEKPIPDPEEPINGVFFIEAGKIIEMIAKGQSDNTGAYTGVCTSLSALMIHFAKHPEHFPQ